MSQLARTNQTPAANPIAKVGPDTDFQGMAKMFAESGFFKDSRSAAQAGVKILAGRELGIPPVAAMTGIHIVKEKVMLGASVLAAVVQRSGKYDFRVKQLDNTGCALEFLQGSESLGISTFGVKEATAAGLMGGDNYRKFTRNMFFARALSNGVKWFCPGVLSGPVYTPEELDVPTNAQGEPILDDDGTPKTFTQKLEAKGSRIANMLADPAPATAPAPTEQPREVVDEAPPPSQWSDLNAWRMHCDELAKARNIDPEKFDRKKAAALKARKWEADFQSDETFRAAMVEAINAGKFD